MRQITTIMGELLKILPRYEATTTPSITQDGSNW